MQYNTEREKLIIPEYGRHIQEMVEHCKNIEDKDERNDFAQAIIEVMGNLNPHLRDVQDFQHKLWDQLFIMSGFELEVESPFPIPEAEQFEAPPQRLEYPSFIGRYRYYGRNIQRMIEVARKWEDGEKKQGLIRAIANQMKKSYLLWNKDTVDDRVIFNQLRDMSRGEIEVKDMVLASAQQLVGNQSYRKNNSSTQNRKKKQRRRV